VCTVIYLNTNNWLPFLFCCAGTDELINTLENAVKSYSNIPNGQLYGFTPSEVLGTFYSVIFVECEGRCFWLKVALSRAAISFYDEDKSFYLDKFYLYNIQLYFMYMGWQCFYIAACELQ
jgi:hypothetical protein